VRRADVVLGDSLAGRWEALRMDDDADSVAEVVLALNDGPTCCSLLKSAGYDLLKLAGEILHF
jgi:hypothetical protein